MRDEGGVGWDRDDMHDENGRRQAREIQADKSAKMDKYMYTRNRPWQAAVIKQAIAQNVEAHVRSAGI